MGAFLREIKTRAAAQRCKCELVATGGKPAQDFSIALNKHPASWNILLLDSEGPHTPSRPVNLCAQQGWSPYQADSIFWMVEMMESWFHADKDALQRYYGTGFRRDALKPNPQVEQIPKQDLTDGLRAATKDTVKGRYHKTKHAPVLLEMINPALVRQAAPHCQRLFAAVLAKLTATCA